MPQKEPLKMTFSELADFIKSLDNREEFILDIEFPDEKNEVKKDGKH